jgi:hypothetical protein
MSHLLSAYPNNPAISQRRSEVMVYVNVPSHGTSALVQRNTVGLGLFPCFFYEAGNTGVKAELLPIHRRHGLDEPPIDV